MDKGQAPKSAIEYARFIKRTTPGVQKIFLFGSYARGTHGKDSDIDLAIVFERLGDAFDMQVELMKKRRKFDTRIEPHPFAAGDFNLSHPLACEIIRTGREVL
ncbi:MAG: nucleotidyltransferase domain-containing protein [Thermodesulfobacteriota bacterium]|nr:nucleotidyltransferase domain-containing protein [Thermodesulfobacteriota bacterium]